MLRPTLLVSRPNDLETPAELKELGALPHTSGVLLVSHHLLELQLPHLENAENNSTCYKGLEDHTRAVILHWGQICSPH